MADSVRAKNRSERERKKDQLTRKQNRQERKTTAWQEREEAKQTRSAQFKLSGLLRSLVSREEDRELNRLVAQEDNQATIERISPLALEAYNLAHLIQEAFNLLRNTPPLLSSAQLASLRWLAQELEADRLRINFLIGEVVCGLVSLKDEGVV